MERAVLTEYDSIVCVDRSGSMSLEAKGFSSRWEQAKEITLGIAGLAQTVDDDGITLISFGGSFNPKRDIADGVKMDAVTQLFTNQSPGGSTPLDKALYAAFDKKFSGSKKAVIFVITDGEPDDKNAVANVIRSAVSRIPDASHIRMLFLQVGDDKGAAAYLNDLDSHLTGAKFDIVNTVSFAEANALSPDDLYARAIQDSH
jgi:Mg-chelatase subunit ChlD